VTSILSALSCIAFLVLHTYQTRAGPSGGVIVTSCVACSVHPVHSHFTGCLGTMSGYPTGAPDQPDP
jgi:hypothetical protein